MIFASSRLTEGTASCPSPLLIITERERERLIKSSILFMFMIGSKILRLMMSSFYVRVAYLVSIFRLLKKKMAVVIISVVIATWEAILLHTLETQRESMSDLGTNYLQNGIWYQQTTMYTLMQLFLRY